MGPLPAYLGRGRTGSRVGKGQGGWPTYLARGGAGHGTRGVPAALPLWTNIWVGGVPTYLAGEGQGRESGLVPYLHCFGEEWDGVDPLPTDPGVGGQGGVEQVP